MCLFKKMCFVFLDKPQTLLSKPCQEVQLNSKDKVLQYIKFSKVLFNHSSSGPLSSCSHHPQLYRQGRGHFPVWNSVHSDIPQLAKSLELPGKGETGTDYRKMPVVPTLAPCCAWVSDKASAGSVTYLINQWMGPRGKQRVSIPPGQQPALALSKQMPAQGPWMMCVGNL